MTEYNAGAARATYELDRRDFLQGVAEIRRGYAEIVRAAQQAQLSQAPGRQTVVPRSEAPGARPVGGGSGVDAQAQRAAIAAAKLAAEQNKAALAAQRLATEEGRTAVQLANTERAQTQAAASALRYSQQQQRAAAAASGGRSGFSQLTSSLQNVQQAFGALGVGIGVASLLQAGADAGRYSIQVRQTEGVLRQLSGSQERYNTLTRIAAENQRLFGGTLADNYAPLTGVLALSNQTGASLQQLNQASQLLLAKAPGKNAGDAFFGLGEFLSSTGAEAALSLADQFNLNKKALAELAKEGVSAEDRLNGLFALLASQGVTQETLNARLTDQAVAYNELGAAIDQFKLRAGDLAAGFFEPAARGATRVASTITEAIDGLGSLDRKFRETSDNVIRGAASYDDYRARLAFVNEQLRGAGFAQLPELARAQFEAEQAALRQAAAAQQAATAEEERRARNEASAAAAFGVVNASNAQAEATRTATEASSADAIAKLRDASTAEVLAAKNAEMEAAIRAAAAGSDTAAIAALNLANVYGQAQYPELLKIINALREKAALEGGSGALDAGLRGVAAAGAARQREREQAAALAAAQQRYTEATESSTARVARLRGELRQLTPGTAAYVNTQTELAQALRAVTAEQQRGSAAATRAASRDATAAARDATAMARAREQEYQAARDTAQKIEDLRRDHFDKLRRLEEDYLLSASRDREDFEIEKQRLLAEGQIKEAQLLEERFNREQRREAEDRAVAARREQEQSAEAIAEAQAKAAQDARDRAAQRDLSGTPLPGDVSGQAAAGAAAPTTTQLASAQAAQAAATLAATAGQRPAALQLNVQIAPTAVMLDGGQIVTVIWPAISQLVDASLSEQVIAVNLAAPPGGGQGSGVGGPTP